MTSPRFAAFVLLAVASCACAQSVATPPANAMALSAFQSKPAAQQAPPQARSGIPQAAEFCAKDSRPEVLQFCPWLSELMTGVKKATDARKTEIDAMNSEIDETKKAAAAKKIRDAIANDVQVDLDNLDPSNDTAGNQLVDAVMAQTQVKTAIAAKAAAEFLTALDGAGKSVLQTALQMNTNQQLGAINSAAGTTSLISKAGSSALMNLAIDSGALSRSVNGATATLSLNTDEIYSLVTGSPEYNFAATPNAIEANLLNPLSLTASFALAQTSSTTAPAAGQASGTTPIGLSNVALPTGIGKLTSFTAKYQVPNKYDPRSKKFRAAWKAGIAKLAPSAIAAANANFDVRNALAKDPTFLKFVKKAGFQTCRDALLDNARNQDSSKLVSEFEDTCWQMELHDALANISPDFATVAATYMSSQANLRTAYKRAVLDAAGTMFSGQYTFNKPLNQPATHDLTFIFAYDFGNRGSLTFNGAASIYNGALPAAAKYDRIHYGQASAEYDRNLNNPANSLQSQLSLAGYWQYQPQPSVLNIPAGTVAPGTTIPLPNGTQEFVGTAGSLWVTQAKITIKGPDGINIPMGVSWSNKTDLLQGSKVGGQVGLSYNFSSLAGLFNGH